MQDSRIRELLELTVDYLADEREYSRMRLFGADTFDGLSNDDLFAGFRALVNTRQPLPASEDFIQAQDELLQALIAEKGVSRVEDANQAPDDPRIRVWQGNIVTFAADGIVNAVLTYGVLGIIIIFQPEIRQILEKMGQTNNEYVHNVNLGERERILGELVNCITDLSKTQTGALITFERHQSLQDFINTGIKFDAEIKNELLKTIFYEGTPLHDGATIIKNDRIVASACFYPPTNKEVPAKYGARHRAAIGISEITDSLTVVVSEETGTISFVTNGDLRPVNPKELRGQLVKELDWYHSSDEGDQNE